MAKSNPVGHLLYKEAVKEVLTPTPLLKPPTEAFIDSDAVGAAPGSILAKYGDYCGSNVIPASISL